jgi:hypothetical protein
MRNHGLCVKMVFLGWGSEVQKIEKLYNRAHLSRSFYAESAMVYHIRAANFLFSDFQGTVACTGQALTL